MGCCGNYLVGMINWFVLMLSLPFLIVGWIMKQAAANSPCEPVIYKPLFIVGIFLLALSLAGILGSCCRCTFFLWIYQAVVFVLIIVFAFLIVFGSVYIRGGPGETVEVQGANYMEYRLQDYPSWLRRRLVDDHAHWADITSCLIHHDACGKFQMYRSVVDFVQVMNKDNLTPIETGCCKPPVHCGFEYVNTTSWKAPEKGFGSEDQDCKVWSNQQELLCYNCDSCKAGYIAMFVKYWKKLSIFNIIVFLLLVAVFLIGCCALH